MINHLQITNDLYQYILDISLREHPVLKALREETAQLPLGLMQISPEQGQLMQMLIRISKATRVLEIGTFTGYSALAMALALPDNGQLLTCDINPEWTNKAHPYWAKAKQDHKITLRLGKALDTLNTLVQEAQIFDFIFIDADKTNYYNYYELALTLLSPGGLIAIDNIFWDGEVINPENHDAQTREIRRLNNHIKTDTRVDISLLAISDGLFLVQKK